MSQSERKGRGEREEAGGSSSCSGSVFTVNTVHGRQRREAKRAAREKGESESATGFNEAADGKRDLQRQQETQESEQQSQWRERRAIVERASSRGKGNGRDRVAAAEEGTGE